MTFQPPSNPKIKKQQRTEKTSKKKRFVQKTIKSALKNPNQKIQILKRLSRK